MTGMAAAATAATRKASGYVREANDFYRTPAEATRALLAVESLPHRVWEPACGDGAMSRVLEDAGHEVVSTDLVDRGYGENRRDFLFELKLLAPCVCTNPPFKLADEFALHALHLGAEKVCMFMRLGWLEGRARHASLWSRHPPARVWVSAARLTLWRGDQERRAGASGAVAFAWFVWTRDHVGDPALKWLAP